MLTFGTGTSHNADSFAAAVEATELALHDIDTPSLLFVFAAHTYDHHAIIQGVRSVNEKVTIVGGSTAGEITPHEVTTDPSVVVMALSAPQGAVAGAAVEMTEGKAFENGTELAALLREQLGSDPATVVVFPDGLSPGIASLLRGIERELGTGCTVFGASTADGERFNETTQYFNNLPLTRATVAVAFSSAIKVTGAAHHGWNPVGLPQKVTTAEGTIVSTIGSDTALTFYESYLGADLVDALDETTHLVDLAKTYPIGFRDEMTNELLLRVPHFLRKPGSIEFAGEVPEGAEVRLMIGGKDEAHEAGKRAATQAREATPASPRAALILASHIRKTVYGRSEEARKEVADIHEIVGEKLPLVGFYGLSEIAPQLHAEKGKIKPSSARMLNGSVLVLLFSATD